jgi:hypothetical protein
MGVLNMQPVILTEPFHRNCAAHEGHGRLLAE